MPSWIWKRLAGEMSDHRARSFGIAGSNAAVRAAPNVGAGHARDWGGDQREGGPIIVAIHRGDPSRPFIAAMGRSYVGGGVGVDGRADAVVDLETVGGGNERPPCTFLRHCRL